MLAYIAQDKEFLDFLEKDISYARKGKYTTAENVVFKTINADGSCACPLNPI